MSVRIKYSKGLTINLGSYESKRVDIGIEVDCEESEVASEFKRIKTWVEAHIERETTR